MNKRLRDLRLKIAYLASFARVGSKMVSRSRPLANLALDRELLLLDTSGLLLSHILGQAFLIATILAPSTRLARYDAISFVLTFEL